MTGCAAARTAIWPAALNEHGCDWTYLGAILEPLQAISKSSWGVLAALEAIWKIMGPS